MTMAKYTFTLDKYEIKKTRSRHEDTNYVTAVLSVNGHPIGNPKTKFMGNQNNGTFAVGFSWPDVEAPDGATVSLNYLILNSGHKHPDKLEKALSLMAQQAVNLESDVTKWLLQQGITLAFADCDGPITPPAGRKIQWSTSDLKTVARGTKFHDKQNEPGNKSPVGCGGNSHYIVHYTVAAA
jgi:hypothetical protein